MNVLLWGLGFALLGLILAFLVYLYLSGHFRPAEQYRLTGIPASSPDFPSTVASMSDSLVSSGVATHFWADIDVIQMARLKLIAKAQRLIQFETFIMTPGNRVDEFAAALKRKAVEGVSVQVLADSYGARTLPDGYWRSLTNVGVEVRFFNPFSKRAPLDYLRRNHRKLLVVDQQVAMVGGAGIADRWDGDDQYAGRVS